MFKHDPNAPFFTEDTSVVRAVAKSQSSQRSLDQAVANLEKYQPGEREVGDETVSVCKVSWKYSMNDGTRPLHLMWWPLGVVAADTF